ncbi:unnamed protein product [Schistosoma mattheei]|uniref:Uncharacterized protein n=1 Tax=Schistosoma mattheei TaxID=31246 RepID=A0A183Q410_9TREM|nr:unnamed protein product [Schistosoma mattheei]
MIGSEEVERVDRFTYLGSLISPCGLVCDEVSAQIQRAQPAFANLRHLWRWNHCETIDSLLRKGGYRGNISEAFRQSIRLTRYRSEKYSVHASEYLRARQNGYRV